MPKQHADKYSHILTCLRELEAGVLDTAKSNELVSSELDRQVEIIQTMEPELEATLRQKAELQKNLDATFETIRRLEGETISHKNARNDILAQLQVSFDR